MRDGNARNREKFELSLDGRQIASVVVGALVIVGVVFVLGLNVGRQVATRRAASERAGDLDALDRAPAPGPAMDGASLTFHDQLVKQKPPPQPSVTAVAVPTSTGIGSTEAVHAEHSEAATAAERSRGTTPTLTSTSTAISSAAGSPAAVHPERSAAAGGAESRDAAGGAESRGFTIQIGATQQRSEADRIAARYRSLRPRVEAAEVQGKGRWYRVRVGSFDTRDAADRYRRDVSRETGVTGFVTASR